MKTILIRASGCWHCEVVEHLIHAFAFEPEGIRPILIADVPREIMEECRETVAVLTDGRHKTYPALMAFGPLQVGPAGRDAAINLTGKDFAAMFTRPRDRKGEIEGFRVESAQHLSDMVREFLGRKP